MKRYLVIVDEGEDFFDFEAILDVGMDECQAYGHGFKIISVTEEDNDN